MILSRTLHTFGLGESSIAEKLGPLMKRDRNPSVGTTVSGGIVSLRINARFVSPSEAQREMDETAAACRRALGDLIFGEDDETLASVAADLLKRAGKTVATAESCTGGLLAKYLTDIPGSSAYFKQGWVTYTNASKQQQMHVPEALIEGHGAVSEAVVNGDGKCRAMEISGRTMRWRFRESPARTAGHAEKPVGTVCIALGKRRCCWPRGRFRSRATAK